LKLVFVVFLQQREKLSADFRKCMNEVLRSRPQYEYVTSSHLIVAFNQASLLDNLKNSSVNRISRFIDHAQILSERIEK
jgi:hypothetical protein